MASCNFGSVPATTPSILITKWQIIIVKYVSHIHSPSFTNTDIAFNKSERDTSISSLVKL